MAHLRLGDVAPNFKAVTTHGELDFYEWQGESWVVFFSHPADFTPVCTTELGKTSKLIGDFAKRNTKVIALSVDPIESHHEWVKDINETQDTEVTFPIIADADKSIATAYDMIHPNATEKFTVRSVFIIDPNHKVRLTLTYPASTGRNFYELLRVLDSLQLTEYEKVATPADWQHGEDVVILPSVSDELARDLFPQGFTTVKPYLRTTNLNK